MLDKYLIIYENSALIIRKETVSEHDLGSAIERIQLNYSGTILSINKILFSK